MRESSATIFNCMTVLPKLSETVRSITISFFPGFIAHFNEFHEHEFQCQDGSTPKFLGGGFDHVVAVIGDQSSSVTIQVSEMCPTEAQN